MKEYTALMSIINGYKVFGFKVKRLYQLEYTDGYYIEIDFHNNKKDFWDADKHISIPVTSKIEWLSLEEDYTEKDLMNGIWEALK